MRVIIDDQRDGQDGQVLNVATGAIVGDRLVFAYDGRECRVRLSTVLDDRDSNQTVGELAKCGGTLRYTITRNNIGLENQALVEAGMSTATKTAERSVLLALARAR